jgi:hypothetical protein
VGPWRQGHEFHSESKEATMWLLREEGPYSPRLPGYIKIAGPTIGRVDP